MPRLSSTSLLLALVACASVAASAAAAPARDLPRKPQASVATLNVNLGKTPVTLDPGTAYDDISLGLLQNLYVRLTQYGTKAGPAGTVQVDPGRIVPYLARSWSVSKDGKRYTFKLRPAKFNDGTPIDAAAVKYSLDRALKMGNTGAYVIQNGIDKLFKSIQAPSRDTVVLNLNQPNTDMLKDLATAWGSIVDPKVVEQHGGVKAGAVNKWMSSNVAGGGGPFVLESYNPGIGAVLQRNPAFFQAPAKSATIRIKFVPSDVTLALQARSGEADVTIGLSPQATESLAGHKAVRVISNETDAIKRLGLVNTQRPFTNKLVRQALTYAVPYEDILKKVARGYGTLMFGPLAPVIPGFDKGLVRPRTFDLDRAKDLLKQSGVTLPVTVRLAIQNDIAVDQQIATTLQSVWRPLGVNVEIVRLSAADMVTAVVKYQYPMFIHNWSPFVYSTLYSFGLDAVCAQPFNSVKWCNRTAETLFKKAQKTSDPKKVSSLVNRVIKLYNGDAPHISLYLAHATTVLSNRVRSYTFAMQMDMRSWG